MVNYSYIKLILAKRELGNGKYHTIKIISLSDIKTMLPKYLLNYDISWDDLLNCSDTVFLTYGYSEEEGEEKNQLVVIIENHLEHLLYWII